MYELLPAPLQDADGSSRDASILFQVPVNRHGMQGLEEVLCSLDFSNINRI